MAMGWLAFQLTSSPFQLGLVYTLNTLPILLLSIYAGSIADRFPKLAIFKATSWFAMACSLAFALLIFSGKLNIGLLMAFAVLWGTAMAFEMPSRQSLMMDLVGPNNLVNAIALNSAMINASRIIGPALAGPLLAGLGAAWCFLFDACSFVAVLYGLYQIRMNPQLKTSAPARRTEHLWEGIRYIKGNPVLFRAMSLLLFMSIGGWTYQTQLPAFVRTQLGLAEWGYVGILASAGLGSCVAALLVATQGPRLVKETTLYAGIGIYCFFIFLFGFQHHPVFASLAIFAAAFGATLFFSTTNSLLQSRSPTTLRGRVMGIWSLVFGGGMPIGSFLIGSLAAQIGSGTALQAGGVFCLVAGFSIFLISKRIRREFPQ
jgi:MFS family permease